MPSITERPTAKSQCAPTSTPSTTRSTELASVVAPQLAKLAVDLGAVGKRKVRHLVAKQVQAIDLLSEDGRPPGTAASSRARRPLTIGSQNC